MTYTKPGIGPFFFEDENEESVTVNTKNYIDEALKPFWQVLGRRWNIQRDQEWFQQDGTTRHTSEISLAWVQEHFNERQSSSAIIISIKTANSWAPHSPEQSNPNI